MLFVMLYACLFWAAIWGQRQPGPEPWVRAAAISWGWFWAMILLRYWPKEGM